MILKGVVTDVMLCWSKGLVHLLSERIAMLLSRKERPKLPVERERVLRKQARVVVVRERLKPMRGAGNAPVNNVVRPAMMPK